MVEGNWNLPDHFLYQFADRLRAENIFDKVFYEGTIVTNVDFMLTMKAPGNLPVFLFCDTEPLGVAWINGAAGNMAFVHFAFLKKSWGKVTKNMGKRLLDYWFSFPGEDGPLFEFLFGMMPTFNRQAFRYMKSMGFKVIGEVPKFHKSPYHDDLLDIVVSYYPRTDHG